MQKSLPDRPNLNQLKKQAKDLVKSFKAAESSALAIIREGLPSFAEKTDAQIAAGFFSLNDAQLLIARRYGFSNWNELHHHVESINQMQKLPLNT